MVILTSTGRVQGVLSPCIYIYVYTSAIHNSGGARFQVRTLLGCTLLCISDLQKPLELVSSVSEGPDCVDIEGVLSLANGGGLGLLTCHTHSLVGLPTVV